MSKINIVLAPDNNYAKPSAVVMASVLAHASNAAEIRFFILDDGRISDSNKQKMRFVQERGAAIEFLPIVFDDFKDFPESGYITVNMWYRLKIASVLPADVSRALYLDCDTIVNAPLDYLFEMDMGGNLAGGAIDCWWKKFDKRNGFKKGYRYFNSGVLLIDVDAWRKRNVEKELFDFLREDPSRLRLLDQTVLNKVLGERTLQLGIAWNFQYVPPYLEEACYLSDKEEYLRAFKNPKIVHFVGIYKPWVMGLADFNVFKNLYYRHLRSTPYAFESDAAEATFHAESRKCRFAKILPVMLKRLKRKPLYFFKPHYFGRIILERYVRRNTEK